MKQERRTKEEGYFTILFKLLRRYGLTRPDIEKPKLKKLGCREEIEKIPKKDYVPHSSLIKRLKELEKMGAIESFDSGKLSKINLPIDRYDLTFLGVIKLLQLCDEKHFEPEIMSNLRLGRILIGLGYLENAFSKEQLYETLVYVCKNTRIQVYDNSTELKEPTGKVQFLTGAEILDEKSHDIFIYSLEIILKYPNFSYIIDERMLVFEKNPLGKKIRPKLTVRRTIDEMLSSAFYYELMHRSMSVTYIGENYPGEKGKLLVLELVRKNRVLKPAFLKFLDKIQRQNELRSLETNELKSDILKVSS